jgi:hypothetical protein
MLPQALAILGLENREQAKAGLQARIIDSAANTDVFKDEFQRF